MAHLSCRLPDSLWHALNERACRDGEPVSHLVAHAVAQFLEVNHATIFQVSTSSALVEGVYQGAVRVGKLREHGNLGLGTFDHLDGEMVVVDGEFYQVRADGTVSRAADDMLSPFAVVTDFAPDHEAALARCASLTELTAAFDSLRDSPNFFFALRADGRFERVHTRAMCRSEEGVPLAEAAAHQPEFEFGPVEGTLVGFWAPQYTKTLNVPGYHLHFVDRERGRGGHLLECSSGALELKCQRVTGLTVALPETADFIKADFSRDPSAALAYAEQEHRK
ncbi:MAG TPA: acetolactate decarboxylase [Candidatus Binataceae bacterium]|nr:acetolactate decarboxylase [Candidatus Binataceae bacterium]